MKTKPFNIYRARMGARFGFKFTNGPVEERYDAQQGPDGRIHYKHPNGTKDNTSPDMPVMIEEEQYKIGSFVRHKDLGYSLVPDGVIGVVVFPDVNGKIAVRYAGYPNSDKAGNDYWLSRPEAVISL